ncbi:U3 snoRNP protein [Scheffersomyces spartinae]|uniref:U3 snoRNP protein n=1 Tax=Scheffersomyces spartinae TaxID=45513 RepID=A0A9P7VAB1_9ASCO|nr:U3 snoRNP protein [Scheffersomyces spartinae]KAG7193733.1 U3 snoRNP protein [Scheffersomyces spartinae]
MLRKTTESSRKRHTFRSFKERVDSLKIEPHLNLRKRVHDYAETSHFLTCLEHWKEVNISANFTEFLDKTENVSQTLPQILHHQDTIFEALCVHIKVIDNHSLQPLFELLAQFIHDLGPDFMPFYEDYLKLVLEVVMTMNPNNSQNNLGSSHVLEWAFNCLAFTFKYLSRTLTEDLIPTFDLLMPLLQLQKRVYLSRFCAEALSFLIRKLKGPGMDNIIRHTMKKDLILDNDEYAKTLVVLYSEAIKNTKETFHSKSTTIISSLVSMSLEIGEPKYISIVSDILLDVLHHGAVEECKNFYKVVLEIISSHIEKNQDQRQRHVQYIGLTQLLMALSFAESGRKVPDWEQLTSVIIDLISKLQPTVNYLLLESVLYLIIVLIRNGDFQVLTKYHVQLFEFVLKTNEGEAFLAFVDASLNTSKEKLLSLGIKKYVQDYIMMMASTNDKDNHRMKLALFLSRSKNPIESSLYIPKAIQTDLIDKLPLQLTMEQQLLDVYWKLLLLNHSTTLDNDNEQAQQRLLKVFYSLIANGNLDSKFSKDVAGILLDSIAVTVNDSNELSKVFHEAINSLTRYQESSIFIGSLTKLISSPNFDITSINTIDINLLMIQLTQNLALPDHHSRYNAILLLMKLIKESNHPQVLLDIRILEEIPLTLTNGRDITLRIRNLGIEFKKINNHTDLEKHIMCSYLFGLLTNKFQPCWSAVVEVVPEIIDCGCSELIWDLAYKFICFNYSNQNGQYYDSAIELSNSDSGSDSDILQWQASASQISSSFGMVHQMHFCKYYWILKSIYEYAQTISADNVYSSVMRTRALEILAAIPSVAEKKSDRLVPLVMRREGGDGLDDEGEVGGESDGDTESSQLELWTLKDRNDLMSLFTKFRKLRKIPDAEDLYQHSLRLLCHKQLLVQKIALDVVLNYNNNSVNKYRDNLKNLLDDTIFRDEISKFIMEKSSESSIIETQDINDVMPLILRILFGRVQGSTRSNSKQGKKFAVITVLPNLTNEQMIEFLCLGSSRTGYIEYFETSSLPTTIDHFVIRRLSGFISLLGEVYDTLGPNYNQVLETTIKPLVYGLVVSQSVIDNDMDVEDLDNNLIKAARNVRQNGLRCLNQLFELLGGSFNWVDYVPYIYELIVKPRLVNFAAENLQQPSSLLRIITKWINSNNMNIFLYVDDFATTNAIVSLLANRNAKDSVIDLILDFSINALTAIKEGNGIDERKYTLLAILVDSLLHNLTEILTLSESKELNAKIIEILLLLVDGSYIDDDDTRSRFVPALTKALDKPQSQLDQKDKANLLTSLSAIIIDYNCTFEDLELLYIVCSKGLKMFTETNIRNSLVSVFQSIGLKFQEYNQVGNLIEELNSFSKKRISEPDFQTRLEAYKKINEELYLVLSPIQWVPLIYNSLYFINFDDELALRTSSTYMLNRFIDCFSNRPSMEDAKPYIHVLKDNILPYLRIGLRNKNETVQTEYISFLSHIVGLAKYFDDFNDMKVLLFGNDEEANFFNNINHIQLHRRQRALKRVVEFKSQLLENTVAHYILPLVEHYCICTDDKMRNIANEALNTLTQLIKGVNWNQYRALFKRYIGNIKTAKPEVLKDHVSLVVAMSSSFKDSHHHDNDDNDDIIKNIPKDQLDIDKYVLGELTPTLLAILNKRDDETIIARAPICEALTMLILTISPDQIEKELPGILTNTCQVMRSRSEELREAIRKTLGRIANILGPQYFKFIIKELKTALSRGSQIHVLSYTVHYLLVSISTGFTHGDLDESVVEVVEIIMEDIFGSAGQEKEAEGYHSKMKEVKYKKSYDSGEILSSFVSLSQFGSLIEPIKLLLNETLSNKVENKLDELLKRYALGLNHNQEASSTSRILQLSYEVHNQSASILEVKTSTKPKPVSEVEDHFLVKLNSKVLKPQVEYSQYIATLQKFSFEILKAAITRNPDLLLKPELLQGFVPLLEQGLKSTNEGINISCLRVLNQIIRLSFPEETENIFTTCTRSTLTFVKDSPSTNSELCQASLKLLATIIRHKPNIPIKHTTISYLLLRLQPDLEEPNRQGLAFNFLKAVVSQHIMIPEVYDTMEKVSKNMIVNHAKEIRDMARNIYFLFLMEYDQGRGKLENQFKFLVNNLNYPTQEGRQSVMELLHLIINKCGEQLLKKLSSSFFVALANVLINDDSPKCREMATSLISGMFKKLQVKNMSKFEDYIKAWLVQDNLLLRRCGFLVYRIYISVFGFGSNEQLDTIALSNIKLVLQSSTSSNGDANWEYVYVTLNVFTTIANSLESSEILSTKFGSLWYLIFDTLLFPHAWVRLVASKLVNFVLTNMSDCKFPISDYQIQTLAYRLLRQLGAPLISESMGSQVVKNLVLISMHWEANNVKYQKTNPVDNEEDDDDDDKESLTYTFAIELIVKKIAGILRLEHNYKNSFQSKKSSIQLAAMLTQIVSQQRLAFVVEQILLALYNFTELNANNSEQETELVNLTLECMQMCEAKLGTTEYTLIYSKVKHQIQQRRVDRKTKRAQMAISNPEAAALRKLKKHQRGREKRKHEKDDNGFYRSKKNRFS